MTRDIFLRSKIPQRKISEAMIKEEIAQVQSTGLDCYRYGFISRSGFDCDTAENRILINLDELYKRL